MMSRTPPLPPDYSPYKNLVICGNRLVNGLVPISVSGEIPFLIGKGPEPLIWLNMMTDTGPRPLMRASQKLHDEVTIQKNENDVWQIHVRSETVIEFRITGDESAEITKLDLHPLGLAISGDSLGLHVGGSHLLNNTFNNVGTMVAIGGREEAKSIGE
jgi:hypothetical protein